MREALRGFTTAVLEDVADRDLEPVATELARLAATLEQSADLHAALTDDALPTQLRLAIVEDLLADARKPVRDLAAFAVRSDRAGETGANLAFLAERAGEETVARDEGVDPDLPVGHHAVDERLEGYVVAVFARARAAGIDRVESELYQLARLVEDNRELRRTLEDLTLPARLRAEILADLLHGTADRMTVRIAGYAVRQNRGQLAAHLDWIAGRVADERGRRTAEVRSAVELRAAQQRRLARALSAVTGREVSLHITVEPGLLGGLRVVVGDTVLDGTVRRRLEQVRAALVHGVPRATPRPEEEPA